MIKKYTIKNGGGFLHLYENGIPIESEMLKATTNKFEFFNDAKKYFKENEINNECELVIDGEPNTTVGLFTLF